MQAVLADNHLSPESPEMAPVKTDEQRLASLEARADNTKEALGNLTSTVDKISDAITEIQNDLKWHRNVGWGIVVLFIGAFAWVINVYLPDKFNDKLPANFKEDWGKLQQNVSNIQDRLNRLTPAAIDRLIPTNGEKSTTAIAQLRRASEVIDVAVRTQIPGDPKYISLLQGRTEELAKRSEANPELYLAAISTAIRLGGYAIGSEGLLAGLKPINVPTSLDYGVQPHSSIIGFTFDCVDQKKAQGEAAHFLGLTSKDNFLVFDVRVLACRQHMEWVHWVKDEFVGSTIEYDGGPLYLADVTFTNCTFKFGDNPQSKRALAAITASHGKPVNLLISD